MRASIFVVTSLAVWCAGCVADVDGDGSDDGAGADPLAATQKIARITTISYAPNSYVIGNAYASWTDVIQGPAQFSSGPGNEGGAAYRWGYLYGENFDHCAWVNDDDVSGTAAATARCGSPQQIDTPSFLATYTDGIHNSLAGDGSVTHMHYAGSGCSDHAGYGNVEPWRSPATPDNSLGDVPDGKELLWRYVSHDGDWVLVRDPAPPANQPNWYFVHRGCVSLENTD